MTLLDTSTKKTFVYEGLKEGVKYFFAVKSRNTAGESEFSAVASEWMERTIYDNEHEHKP